MKRKELFLMIVPCLLLLGAGVYFTKHKPMNSFRIVVEKAELRPVTPREIAKGFDTKVFIKTRIISLAFMDKKPDFRYAHRIDAKIVSHPNGVESDVPSILQRKIMAGDMRISGRQQENTILLKLAEIPVSQGALDYYITVHGEKWNDAERCMVAETPVTPILLPLRQSGQRIKLPSVSKQQPFRLTDVTCQWLKEGTKTPQLYIEIYLMPVGTPFSEKDLLASKSREHTIRNRKRCYIN